MIPQPARNEYAYWMLEKFDWYGSDPSPFVPHHVEEDEAKELHAIIHNTILGAQIDYQTYRIPTPYPQNIKQSGWDHSTTIEADLDPNRPGSYHLSVCFSYPGILKMPRHHAVQKTRLFAIGLRSYVETFRRNLAMYMREAHRCSLE